MSWTKDPYITAQIGLMSRLFIFLLLLKKNDSHSLASLCALHR